MRPHRPPARPPARTPPTRPAPRPPSAVWPFRPSAPPSVPGIVFVTGDGPSFEADAADVAALWRAAAPVPGVRGDDPARVALALTGTFAVVAAYLEEEEEEEAAGAGGGRTLVGVARVLSDGQYAGLLSDVAVAPSARRRGIGRALVARAAAEARARGTSSVVAFVPPGRARLFFQRCAFRVSAAYRVLRYEGKGGEWESLR